MELIKPRKEFLSTYRDAVVESYENNIDEWKPFDPKDYDAWKENIISVYKKVENKRTVPEGRFHTISYWYMDQGVFIGEVQLRPSLEEKEALMYGHVSYAIRYSKWGMGYGTKILAAILNKACDLDMKKVNAACHKSNVGSIRVIEKCGGKLIHESQDPNGEAVNVYALATKQRFCGIQQMKTPRK